MSTVAERMAIGALVACAAAAQPPPIPGWFLAGKNPGAYVIALDHETTHGGSASAILRCAQKRCSEFATLMQTIRADAYLGHRICLSAWVKGTEDDGPRLWMRVDGEAGQMLAFDNMGDRGKRGAFEWTRQEIILDVMPPAALISFGLILKGNGAAWLDDISLDVAPAKSKTTNMLPGTIAPGNPAGVRKSYDAAKPGPTNLDFEDQPER